MLGKPHLLSSSAEVLSNPNHAVASAQEVCQEAPELCLTFVLQLEEAWVSGLKEFI